MTLGSLVFFPNKLAVYFLTLLFPSHNSKLLWSLFAPPFRPQKNNIKIYEITLLGSRDGVNLLLLLLNFYLRVSGFKVKVLLLLRPNSWLLPSEGFLGLKLSCSELQFLTQQKNNR